MNSTVTSRSDLSRRIGDAIRETVSRFEVPGAQVAWTLDGVTEDVAAGGVRIGGRPAITSDTRFPLGSVAKVFTASIALQLVGDGDLELDGPIEDRLPDGRCREVLGDVTLRQLLTHTSGLESDHAGGEGARGSTREYVRACVRPRLFDPGEHFSYANAGYVVVGHLVEQAAGQSWAEMVQSFLLDPLEVRGGFFLSEPAAPGTMAEGHVRRPDGEIAPLVAGDRAGREWAPAGGLALSATGLLRLARLHLDGGRTPLGFPLLDAGLVAEMRSPAVTVPDPTFADAWGLGWALFGGAEWFGHDGEDEGWTTRVRASVDGRFAIAMVANCLPAQREWKRLVAALADAGVVVGDPTLPEPAEPAPPIDASIVGRYENGVGLLAVVERDERFWLTNDHERLPLRPLDEDRCLVQPATRDEPPFVVAFVRDDDGRVRYLHVNGRLARRAA